MKEKGKIAFFLQILLYSPIVILMFPNFSLRSFKKSRILVVILLLCASFVVILGCLLGYRWTQLSEENQSQYTPASYGLMVIQ